jgi:hypothetical protein
MAVLEWKITSAILGGILIWNMIANYLRCHKSSFDGIHRNEEVKLAEKIKNDFAENLEKYGSFIPMSALHYSAEDIKRAFKILSVHDRCDKNYRTMLRNSFGHLSNICSDSDAALMQRSLSESGLSELSEQQRTRFYFLLRRGDIKCNILNYEWDEWMLENHIKQSDSYDDIRRQANDLNLTDGDLRDIIPGEIPSIEELISNREKRAKNLPFI